jgi:hypothetical protein
MAGFTSHPLLKCGDNIKAWMPGTTLVGPPENRSRMLGTTGT